MSLNLKKKKQIEKKIGNLSIEFLYEEKMKYFENNPDKITEMQEYLLNTGTILKKYFGLTENTINVSFYTDIGRSEIEYKKDLEKEYYKVCELTYIDKETNNYIDRFICESCDGEILLIGGIYTCKSCGIMSGVLTDGVSYADIQERQVKNRFIYQRINYFDDWLKQIQGHENAEIPEELIEKVKVELHKRNITDPNKLKPYLLKKILKELKFSKYYENIHLIISKLSSKPLIRIPENDIIRLKCMFKDLQEPFERLKGTRTNFFSYPYTLFKLCELIGLTEYLQFFQLLKSREKIIKHDTMWKKIMIQLQQKDPIWRYIPSC